ncbi:MAG: hypothetical protein HYY26_02015 [Acidobacteria bacterium]|nr:hypothetical protein [Acidobacteriota bacterium]
MTADGTALMSGLSGGATVAAGLVLWEFVDRLPVPAAVCWTLLAVALSLGVWAGLRRWCGGAAGWLALALAGQACSLQLLQVGWRIRLQLFYGWQELLGSYRLAFLLVLVLQGAIVLWGARKLWPRIEAAVLGLVSPLQSLGLLVLYAFAAITIAPGVARAVVSGQPAELARQVVLHASKMGLGLLIFGVGALNLLLAAAAFESGAWERLRQWWQRSDRARLPWLCALWVVLASSVLHWVALDGMPHVPDEAGYIFPAKYLATGRLYLPVPPEPEAFVCEFQLIEGAKWFGAVPAGWPAVLAAGFVAGLPWLVNPLLGGAAILLAHLFLRRLYDREVADGAGLLLAASPWLLFMSASFMPHPLTLVLSLAGLLGIERARREGSLRGAAVAGLSFGALVHVRPLEAVFLAAAAGVWWLAAGWSKLRLLAFALTAVTGLAMVGALLAYNQALTGDPLLFPITRFTDLTYYEGANRIGFGADVGNLGWTGLDALPGHGPLDVVLNTNQNLYLINFEMFGWAGGSLLLVFLLLLWRRWRADGLLWGLLLAVWAGMSCYWFSGGADFGARYWYQMIVPLAALTIRAGQVLATRLQKSGWTPAASQRVWLYVALASVLGIVNLLPWRTLDKYHHYRGIRPDIRRLEREHRFGRSLVLIRGEAWPDYASACIFNPPVPERDAPGPIYVRSLGPESRQRLHSYYAGRPVWILAGPSETGGGFVVISEPVPTTGR